MKTPILCIIIVFLSGCVWDAGLSHDLVLPLDDSEYPYANVQRIVIETDDFDDVRDTETDIPAKIQIYDKTAPVSAVLSGSVRGRGNASFKGMPKYSLKLTFDEKYPLLGMPEDSEWDLVSNSSDKTMMRNYIAFALSSSLRTLYTPRAKYAEVYLNRRYLGAYLVVEHIKVNGNRLNLPKNEGSYLLEKTTRPKSGEIYVTSSWNHIFKIKYPKNPSQSKQDSLKNKMELFEKYLKKGEFDDIEEKMDLDDFYCFYWIQELSKNFDAPFIRSIFIYGYMDQPLHMGPVWDFDAAFGNWDKDYLRATSGWYVRGGDWFKQVLSNPRLLQEANKYWVENKASFAAIIDTIDAVARRLDLVSKNEFKRWPVLSNTDNEIYVEKYGSHAEAVDSLKAWILRRIEWIDGQVVK